MMGLHPLFPLVVARGPRVCLLFNKGRWWVEAAWPEVKWILLWGAVLSPLRGRGRFRTDARFCPVEPWLDPLSTHFPKGLRSYFDSGVLSSICLSV